MTNGFGLHFEYDDANRLLTVRRIGFDESSTGGHALTSALFE